MCLCFPTPTTKEHIIKYLSGPLRNKQIAGGLSPCYTDSTSDGFGWSPQGAQSQQSTNIFIALNRTDSAPKVLQNAKIALQNLFCMY